jgi:hypothetical protein
MGTRYELPLVDHLLRGVMAMEESVAYQAILQEGGGKGLREGKRKTVLLLGSKRFGKPSSDVAATIEGIDNIEKLDQLILRVLDAEHWEELLKSAKTRSRRRKSSP